jgi:acyl carrier protein phosphodiesterase
MNFLAHALLAGDDPALVVGGVVGDWIKGPLPGRLPPDLARGVALHRAIDSHADTHPAFRRSRARVSPARRRYAGVLVDIFYDHLLAREWAQLHPRPFAEYRHDVYRQVAERFADLPLDSHYALTLMASEDWFHGYARIDGIADVLARMARRARRPNPLAGGEDEFLVDAEGFREDFLDWLPAATAFVGQWRSASFAGSGHGT